VKKLKYVESKGQYKIKIRNRFTHLENLDHNVDINSGYQSLKNYIKIPTKESCIITK
jgi:hypothetical protein